MSASTPASPTGQPSPCGRTARSCGRSPWTPAAASSRTPAPRSTSSSPFREGRRPVESEAGRPPYPLAFHPLDLAEAALQSSFGFVLEGTATEGSFDPETIPLLALTRAPGRLQGADDNGNRYDDPSPEVVRRAAGGSDGPGSYFILQQADVG